jgi:hypothetical protein
MNAKQITNVANLNFIKQSNDENFMYFYFPNIFKFIRIFPFGIVKLPVYFHDLYQEQETSLCV